MFPTSGLIFFFFLQMLRDKFREFARDTSTIGQEHVDGVNGLADDLIESGHPENASVAEWKDGLNEAWADLLELIDTRTQMLAASYELHRFHQDATEVLGRVKEKREGLPSDLGRDLNTVQHLHRQHNTFENDIQALSGQVSCLLIRKPSWEIPREPREQKTECPLFLFDLTGESSAR